jgi:hypothetical protein
MLGPQVELPSHTEAAHEQLRRVAHELAAGGPADPVERSARELLGRLDDLQGELDRVLDGLRSSADTLERLSQGGGSPDESAAR